MQRGRAPRAEYERLERSMRVLLEQADRADAIDMGQSTPLWTEVLRPLLAARVDAFTQGTLSMDEVQFVREREVARFCRQVLDLVDGLAGKGSGLRKEAERILGMLERAEAQGVVPRPEPRQESTDGPG